MFSLQLRRLTEQRGHDQAEQAAQNKNGNEQSVIGQQGRDGTVVEQPPHHPGQRGGGDQKATHRRPAEADAVLRPERGARQDGAQHPAALPQNYGGADAAEQEEKGEDKGEGKILRPSQIGRAHV